MLSSSHRTIVAGVIALMLLGTSKPAKACLNDSHVEAAEAEFRSRYNDDKASPAQFLSGSYNWVGVGALAVGSGLVGACSVTALKRYRA